MVADNRPARRGPGRGRDRRYDDRRDPYEHGGNKRGRYHDDYRDQPERFGGAELERRAPRVGEYIAPEYIPKGARGRVVFVAFGLGRCFCVGVLQRHGYVMGYILKLFVCSTTQ